MSPRVRVKGRFVVWCYRYDARHELYASVHIGKGSHDDDHDAKIGLEPTIEIVRPGRTVREHAMTSPPARDRRERQFLLEEWYV